MKNRSLWVLLLLLLSACVSDVPDDREFIQSEIEQMGDEFNFEQQQNFQLTADAEFEERINEPQEGCPNGCTTRISGCDIKGNISINTGEKIYHVPGQEFYSQTKIDPQYGERWFCTETEAQQNGWRRANN